MIFVIIISVLSILFSLFSQKPESHRFIFMIPLVYLILFIGFKRLHRYSAHNKGLFILNIYMFLKYSISILLVVIFKNYSVKDYYYHYIAEESYEMAIFYIIVEMISIFLVIEFFSDLLYKKINKDNNSDLKIIKIGPVLILFIIVSILLIIKNTNEFFVKNSILFSTNNSLTENIEVSNLNSIIFYSIKLIIMGLIINKCIYLYKQDNKFRYILLSYLTIATYTFLNVSTSRLNVILPFLLFILITKDIFKDRTRKLNIAFACILVICFSIISVYKNPWKYTSDDGISSIMIEFTSGVQEYTSNIMPTAMGLQAIDYYKDSISVNTLLNDFLGSIPFISHYIDQNNRIYNLYNMYALNGNSMSQLIPMTVSSIAYFSPIFCWVLVALNVFLLMYCEAHFNQKYNNFLEKYLLIYLYFIFASCLCSNVQMLSGRFFINFLPSFILLYLNKKIKFKKKGL